MSRAPMRVLHVIGPLSTGGAQTQLLGLVRAAHGTLWDATVVGTSGGALVPHFAALGCQFTEMRRTGSPGLLRMRRMRRLVSEGHFDVIHGNLWQSNLYCRTAVYGRSDRPAVVISERVIDDRRGALQRRMDAFLAPVTDGYVGNTQAVCDFIQRVHPVTDQEVSHIPNGIEATIFAKRPAASGRTTITIGAAGRLHPQKGFDVLIEAVARLAPDHPIELHIAGEGPERAALERRASGLPVTFHGLRQPGEEVAEFLRNLDVFVLPSILPEGRPNVVLEASAVGLPVVATAIEGMDEVFHGPNLVPPGSPVALARAIEQAASDPGEWRTRSQPVPTSDFQELATRYAEVFRRAIERATRAPAVGRCLSPRPG